MSPYVGIPRVRYDHMPMYDKSAGFHQIQYEMVFFSDEDLSANEAVRAAVLAYSQDVYQMEIFVADCLHQISLCLDDDTGSYYSYKFHSLIYMIQLVVLRLWSCASWLNNFVISTVGFQSEILHCLYQICIFTFLVFLKLWKN